MKISNVLDAVFGEDVGWHPVSGSIKPVHVANGFFRGITGKYFDTSSVVEMIVWKKYGELIADRTSDSLVASQGALRGFGGRLGDLDELREFLHGVLGADGAAYPSAAHSSLTLSTAAMVSRDNNDRGLGDFVSALLGNSGNQTAFSSHLLRILSQKEPGDPLSVATWPLLEEADGGKPSRIKEEIQRAVEKPMAQAYVSALREAADSLLSHEEEQADHLRTLQRSVVLAVLAFLGHVLALSVEGKLEKRPPLLLSMGPKRSAVSEVSELTIGRCLSAFEGFLAERLQYRLEQGLPLSGDEKLGTGSLSEGDVREILTVLETATSPGGAPTPELVARRLRFFRSRSTSGTSQVEALSRALLDAYLEEAKGTPRAFVVGLCCKAGLFYPHFQGRSKEKRLAPSVSATDTLVRATVREGEAVPLEEFLERLWKRFGIVVGGRGEGFADQEMLRAVELEIDPGLLRENTKAFLRRLEEMGLARQYADSVAYVGEASRV